MKADLLISVTNKIKDQDNKKINIFLRIILNFIFLFYPFIIVLLTILIFNNNDFFRGVKIILSILGVTWLMISPIIIDTFNNYIEILIKKNNLKKKITKEEKIINITEINFEKDNFENGLMDYFISFFNQELSQEEFKKTLKFILIEREWSAESKIKILNYLIYNKYKDQNIIEALYNNNKKDVLFQLIEESKECKKILEELLIRRSEFVFNQSTIQDILDYKGYETLLTSSAIVKKMLDKFTIKTLIKVVFEEDINNINSDELELYKFINNLELERKIEIKKVIIEASLNLKDENNIYDYKEIFLDTAAELNINNKDLLYLIKQKLNQKETKLEKNELSIINI